MSRKQIKLAIVRRFIRSSIPELERVRIMKELFPEDSETQADAIREIRAARIRAGIPFDEDDG